MAVNVPNPGNFQSDVGSVITNLRDAFQQAVNKNNYVTAMGGVTFLTAAAPNGLGMATGDAQALVAALGNIAQSNLPAALTNSETMWGGR